MSSDTDNINGQKVKGHVIVRNGILSLTGNRHEYTERDINHECGL